MESERAQKIVELFHAALSLDASERPGFLARIDDEAMRPEVESLLAALEQAEGDNFISAPAINDVIKMIAEERVKTMIGRKLEHYLLLSPLGAGAMGEVYLAHDPRLGRQVAVKLLPAEFTKDADRVRRFEQEARAASALNHPNIITVHDIGRVDDLYFIVTEYVAGHTLRRQISDTEMKLSEILDVAIQVASALGAAHEAGIAHRDIKPENIMLRRDGYVKVLDFGLAKLIEPVRAGQTTIADSEALTKGLIMTDPGIRMGTRHYMSPEQIRGQEVDGRSDIFSLGVVLYEMVAGRRPFEGASAGDVIAAILDRDPPPLTRYLSEVPAEFERIVSKALEKDREDRYQLVKDLLLDLKSLSRKLEDEIERGPQPRPDFADLTRRLTSLAQQSTGGADLKLWIEKTQANRIRDFEPDQPEPLPRFRLGEKVAICASAEQDCHLWIIDVGATGRVAIIFPRAAEEDNRVSGGQVIRIPGALTGKPGLETIHAFVFKTTLRIESSSSFGTLPAGASVDDFLREAEAVISGSSKADCAAATIQFVIGE
jgi:serine/threonine protein kinase